MMPDIGIFCEIVNNLDNCETTMLSTVVPVVFNPNSLNSFRVFAFSSFRVGGGVIQLINSKTGTKCLRRLNTEPKAYACHVAKMKVLTGNLVHPRKNGTDPHANTSMGVIFC